MNWTLALLIVVALQPLMAALGVLAADAWSCRPGGTMPPIAPKINAEIRRYIESQVRVVRRQRELFRRLLERQ